MLGQQIIKHVKEHWIEWLLAVIGLTVSHLLYESNI
jgi:hypothetical protein